MKIGLVLVLLIWLSSCRITEKTIYRTSIDSTLYKKEYLQCARLIDGFDSMTGIQKDYYSADCKKAAKKKAETYYKVILRYKNGKLINERIVNQIITVTP